jgi:hypothetical protein
MSLYDKSNRKNLALQLYKDEIKKAANVTRIQSSFSSRLDYLYRIGFQDGKTGKLSTQETAPIYWIGRSDGRRAWMKVLLMAKAIGEGKVARFSGPRWEAFLSEMRLNRPLATDVEIAECLVERELLDARLSARRLQGVLSMLRSRA